MLTILDIQTFQEYNPEPGSPLYNACESVVTAENDYAEMALLLENLEDQLAVVREQTSNISWSSDIEEITADFARLPVLERMVQAADAEAADRASAVGVAKSHLQGVKRRFGQYEAALSTYDALDFERGNQGAAERAKLRTKARHNLKTAKSAALKNVVTIA